MAASESRRRRGQRNEGRLHHTSGNQLDSNDNESCSKGTAPSCLYSSLLRVMYHVPILHYFYNYFYQQINCYLIW